VTKDEIPNPDNLELELKVNGEIRQKANTSELIMPVAQLVAYVSQFMTLNPGDVVSTGTPGGVALGMNPPRYLKPGDVVEFSCPAIGTVTQVVEAE
jgi:2-keto-4-pentenoate hydratase/2-oxohepta-3-ene-1,7-dioic acid hydratase in catechol pathway